MNLLTQASLSPDQWAVLRNAPHLVALAVSASGGSRLDAVLERTAGNAAIANGINNDHPLVRSIAGCGELEAAAVAVRVLVTESHGTHRAPEELLPLATEAAREGDVLGLGGRLVSDAERAAIDAIEHALAS